MGDQLKYYSMNKIAITTVCLLSAFTLAAGAAEGAKHAKPGKEAKVNLHKQMLEKYDTNKDSKLDKAERSAISAEDKAAMQAERKKNAEAKEGKEGSEAKEGKAHGKK